MYVFLINQLMIYASAFLFQDVLGATGKPSATTYSIPTLGVPSVYHDVSRDVTCRFHAFWVLF